MSHWKIPPDPILMAQPAVQIEDTAQTPNEIHSWLVGRGWMENYQPSPDGTKLWQHNDDQQNLYYSWSEAVAYEFYRFCNLGSDQGTG